MNPDPLSTDNKPMSYRDAATVATILMLVSAFSVFMPTHGYDVCIHDPPRFLWDLVVFIFSSWVTYFVCLTGLTIYAKRQESGEG